MSIIFKICIVIILVIIMSILLGIDRMLSLRNKNAYDEYMSDTISSLIKTITVNTLNSSSIRDARLTYVDTVNLIYTNSIKQLNPEMLKWIKKTYCDVELNLKTVIDSYMIGFINARIINQHINISTLNPPQYDEDEFE